MDANSAHDPAYATLHTRSDSRSTYVFSIKLTLLPCAKDKTSSLHKSKGERFVNCFFSKTIRDRVTVHS